MIVYLSSAACGIELEKTLVVTGGLQSKTRVAEFTEAGSVKYMASLKTGRYCHACSKFVDGYGNTVSVRSVYMIMI